MEKNPIFHDVQNSNFGVHEQSLIGTQPHTSIDGFFYSYLHQRWLVATQPLWSTESKMSVIWTFKEIDHSNGRNVGHEVESFWKFYIENVFIFPTYLLCPGLWLRGPMTFELSLLIIFSSLWVLELLYFLKSSKISKYFFCKSSYFTTVLIFPQSGNIYIMQFWKASLKCSFESISSVLPCFNSIVQKLGFLDWSFLSFYTCFIICYLSLLLLLSLGYCFNLIF